jgi:hypothetical protein
MGLTLSGRLLTLLRVEQRKQPHDESSHYGAVCCNCLTGTGQYAEPHDDESLSESAELCLPRVRNTAYGKLTKLLIGVADCDVIFTGTIIGRIFIIDVTLYFHLWTRKMRLRAKRH